MSLNKMKMTTTIKEKRHTVSDYLKLGEGDPHQLINGELIALGEPSPTYGHQEMAGDIFTQIRIFLKEKPIGKVICAPMDVYFDENNAFQPDIIFVSNKKKHIIKNDGLHGAPDMIIEIQSPSTSYYDLNVKKKIYEKYGVKELWIIDPLDNSVAGFENSNGNFVKTVSGKDKFISKILNLKITLEL